MVEEFSGLGENGWKVEGNILGKYRNLEVSGNWTVRVIGG